MKEIPAKIVGFLSRDLILNPKIILNGRPDIPSDNGKRAIIAASSLLLDLAAVGALSVVHPELEKGLVLGYIGLTTIRLGELIRQYFMMTEKFDNMVDRFGHDVLQEIDAQAERFRRGRKF